MYIAIKNKEIIASSNEYIEVEGAEVFQIEDNEENLQKIKDGYGVNVSKAGKITFVENAKVIEGKLFELKEKTANKIYGKYTKETQTNVLYNAFFTFANRILQIPTIKSEFTPEELATLQEAGAIFKDIEADVAIYLQEKSNIISK